MALVKENLYTVQIANLYAHFAQHSPWPNFKRASFKHSEDNLVRRQLLLRTGLILPAKVSAGRSKMQCYYLVLKKPFIYRPHSNSCLHSTAFTVTTNFAKPHEVLNSSNHLFRNRSDASCARAAESTRASGWLGRVARCGWTPRGLRACRAPMIGPSMGAPGTPHAVALRPKTLEPSVGPPYTATRHRCAIVNLKVNSDLFLALICSFMCCRTHL